MTGAPVRSRFRRRLTVSFGLLLVAVAMHSTSLIVLTGGDATAGSPTAGDLRLFADGEAIVLDSIEPISSAGAQGLWDFVVYADAELSTADGLGRAARLLAAEAARLTDLGTVRIVLADPEPELLLAASRDADQVAGTLESLLSEVVGTGSLAEKRRRASAALTAIAGQEEAAARSAIRRETTLLDGRRRTLLEWLSVQPGHRPRALFLLADTPLPEASVYYGQQVGHPELDRDEALKPAFAGDTLAQLVATQGWAVFPLRAQAEDSGAEGAAATADPLDILAGETGGVVIRRSSELTSAVETLRQALRVEFDLAVLRSEPLPLDIRTRRPGLRLRYPRWVAAQTPAEISAARARRTLDAETPAAGALRLTAALVLGAPEEPAADEEGALADPDPLSDLGATLESLVRFPAGTGGPPAADFRVTILTRRLDAEPAVEHFRVAGGDLSLSSGWLHRETLEFDEDLQDVAVVVEELTTGAWGADLAFFSETPMRAPDMRLAAAPPTPAATTGSTATESPGTTSTGSPTPSPPPTPGAPTAAARERSDTAKAGGTPSQKRPRRAETGVVIRLLPPRKTALTGKTRFLTLTTSTSIDRVVFYLDGEESDTDNKTPFAGTLDLGSPARPHLIRAVAFSASGRPLAEDELTVNQTGALFQVDITGVTADAVGSYTVAADIAVPPDDRLERVEFYFNETLRATVVKPPFRAQFEAPPAGPQDYLRVVAYLAGGDSLEDVSLLGAGPVEEVDVNLVELYVVVTDFKGVPVKGLEQGRFSVHQGKRTLEIERFDRAVEVPLVMGLVIDTSSSMWALMEETKMAAAQFLGNSLQKGDRAFLVDFATRPRLAHPATGDLLELVRAFASLQPSGFTALYDAIVFTMLQFEEGPGRRALVLLTDGDDYNSRFGPKRCIEYGRRLGIPVYIVALGGLHDSRRGYERADLEKITSRTAGRVFYINSMDELPAAYQQINAELRSQYLLAFSTATPLSVDDLQDITVTVDDPALVTRTVVGGQQIY